ncbi:MAG: hypothetical protein MUF17_08555 [Syntrophales bacterium]|nr:hypothetical protein [Syntrophales bacterium]
MQFLVIGYDGTDDKAAERRVVDFPTRADVDAWLKTEPYVTGGVWKKIEVLPARVPPMFAK